MKTSDGLSDSIPSVSKSPAKCEKCGATTQLHTGVCVSCLLSEGLESGDEVSRAVFESAIAEVNVPDKQWRLGDYEILDEIGRGGMGVIYLARQRHPQRIVAVKRVLNYHADSHETLKRFRREADAAASLDHPNILPIYEVSESEDGLPFFSMKFATGGSLQKVASTLRAEPRRCVQPMVKVARAVEYAHGQGILHRDLKPGNILLDGRGEPLVSDFGLAKWLDANKDITKSLTAFGTPGYTAPEQADGRATALTPAADVYSLGAILFELLAGRPPFLGSNAVAVIRQAAETPAPKLRSLAHSHNRDLETICVRCLERDPKARYQSAGDLATDLERWLDGRPIVARPISVPTRLGRWSRRNPQLLATGAACLLFGAVTMWFFRGDLAKVLPPAPEKSIAVLPFENLSPDPNNAYLADGIQEEILTRLANIADLKVISHTSTQRYQSKPRNLREIAKQLGVANILEGSVQKLADQVRVNVQLINAQTDSHLWAETFDRKSTDIFGVESEIASGIAESLRAKLTGREEQALAVKPTNNPEAYDVYLRGLAFEGRNYYNTSSILEAAGFYERAVQLDPNFAIAWARLSRADSFMHNDYGDPVRRDAAKRALENAQRLAPESPEILLALGYYQYWVLYDYGLAKTTFGRVSKMLPGSSEVPMALGRNARREGHWDESIAYFEKGLVLDPRNVELLMFAAQTYACSRQFPAALKLYDRALDIVPNDLDIMAAKASIYQAQGNLREAASLLSQTNEQTTNGETVLIKVDQLRLERNYAEIVRLLQARLAQGYFDSTIDKAHDQVALALTQRLAGDMAGAKVAAEAARNTFELLCRDQPENAFAAADLSKAYAAMGQKDAALEAAQRAIMLQVRNKDRASAPDFKENLALIQTIFGENGHAISTLAQLLHTPSRFRVLYNMTPITPALLRLDPIWDPLRADPAFQELCKDNVDKSIAVLPFENLSRDLDNAYFAEGIQEEILTRLAGIAELKVISRTSTQRYHSKPGNLAEIAKQLGVANILEGSLQKTADQVRINVQLINAQTDSHLWAETYDRKLTDIFGVESEIAKRIAESLQAKLSGHEELTLAVKATKNLDAYDAYLRGLAFQTRSSWHSDDALRNAIDSYEQAVQLDPGFAPAWARLARAHAWKYSRHEGTVLRRDEATKALENAQRLQPDSPETLLALGYYQRFVLDDWEAAKTTFRRVGEMLPSSSEVPMALGRIARNEGQWDESNSYFERALSMDPRNVELLAHAAWNYTMLRQFPAALKLYDRALDIVPNDSELVAGKASIYQAQGKLQEAVKLLPQINEQTTSAEALRVKITQMRLERRFDEAVHLLQTRLAQFRFFSAIEKSEYQAMLSFHLYLASDRSSANFIAKQARDEIESQLEGSLDWDNLALANAVMGNKDLAIKAAEHAGTLVPTVKDRVNGPSREEWLALIQTIVGENGRAISILTRLVQTPYLSWLYGAPATPALLRLDPIWDPLRGDPAFQKLCEEKQP